VSRSVATTLVLLSLVQPVFSAQPNLTQKKKTVGQLLKQADRGAGVQLQEKQRSSLPKFTQEPVGNSQRIKVDLSRVKPLKTSSFYENANDDKSKLEKITDEQIKELYKLTQKFKNSPQRGELWLRLAELYVEKASVIEFRKHTVYDQKLREFQEGQSKIKPVLDLRDARAYNRQAIQLYEWFTRDFPKDEKMDQALFFLGYNNYEIGELKKGTAFYNRLTKEHPNSPYVVEGHFALGEYYFENEQWKSAHENYRQVIGYKRHRLYSFSLYKLAWCFYRTGRAADALKSMEILIRSGKQQNQEAQAAGRKSINKNRLESEGLRDIVLFYAEAAEPRRAPEFFKSLAGADGDGYVEKLAYLYGDKGNREASKALFQHLIALNPQAAKAFDYKYQVVQLFASANKSREFREELFSWIKDFGIGSAWSQANKGNSELIENSYKLRETTLRNYTLQLHQTAQNSRAPYSQALALEAYRLYLSEFANSPVIADMHFYFAELLYDMNKFEESGTHYRWVVDNAPTSKYANKAAENVVLALERNIPKDDQIAKQVGKSLEPVAFDQKVERFISASQWYIARFPNSEKTPEIKFRVGRLHYQYNQFDQAIPFFREIVQKHSGTKYAEYSANLLLDIFNLKKDYAGLERTAGELLAVPGIANSKTGGDIRGVLEKANFKRAQDLEVAKDYGGSAVQFESFAKQNPTSSLAAAAQFNAAINYERAGMAGEALIAHTAILQSRDKNAESFKPKSRRIVGKLYQDSGMLEEAADAYKVAANEMGNDPLALNLVFNAAVLNETLGRNDLALKEYQAYFEKSKKLERVEALYAMATIYRKQNSLSRASEKYKEYVMAGNGSPEKNVESAYRVHEISRQLGRKSEVENWRQKTLGLQKKYAPQKRGVGATYAAKIHFEDAKLAYGDLRAVRIPANPQKQQAAAQQKIAMMTRLNAQLLELLKYDSPEEIVGALSLLGQANQHLGEALTGAPIPAGFNAEETKQYKEGIQKIAAPFYAKAKESLKAAVDKASELESYGTHYQKARELLAAIDSNLVYDGGEISSDIKQVQWMGL
jgi:tetratricopeptide (TPR) repeat protein